MRRPEILQDADDDKERPRNMEVLATVMPRGRQALGEPDEEEVNTTPTYRKIRMFQRPLAALAACVLIGAIAHAAPSEASGVVGSVDSDKSVIAIQLADGKELSLHVVETTKIMVSGKAGALLDVKPKAKVTVTWTEEKSGDKVAQSISAS